MILFFFLAAVASGQGVTNVPGVQLQDESAVQGQILKLNCTGAGVVCSRSGNVGTLNASAGAGETNTFTSSKTFTSDVLIHGQLTLNNKLTAGTTLYVSDARVGIGTTAPESILHVLSGASQSFHYFGSSMTIEASLNPGLQMRRFNGTLSAPTVVTNGQVIGAYSASGFDAVGYTPNASISMVSSGTYSSSSHGSFMNFNTTPINSTTSAVRMQIDDAGNVKIGTSTGTQGLGYKFEVAEDTLSKARFRASGSVFVQEIHSDFGVAGFGSALDFKRSKGTFTSPVAVTPGDLLGGIVFSGYDDTDYSTQGAAIYGEVDASTGTSIVPGRLRFLTAATTGADNLVERMRINSSGNVGVGTSAPTVRLQVLGGDAAISTQGNGLILRATTGATCWRLTVNSLGVLGTASVTCP